MLALYRGGRQAEALGAYRAARQILVRELGLEPGPALQRLEARDPAAGPGPRSARDGSPAGPRSGRARPRPANPGPRGERLRPRPRTRRTRLAAIAAAGAGVLAASLLIGFRGPAAGQATLAGASGLVAVDTASDQLVHATKLAGAPGAVSGGNGSVWVADPAAGRSRGSTRVPVPRSTGSWSAAARAASPAAPGRSGWRAPWAPPLPGSTRPPRP